MMERRKMKKILRPNSVYIFALALAAIMILWPPASAQIENQEKAGLQTVDYRIGTKDLLEIRVFELPELNQTARVAEDGSVSLAVIGKVEVSGLTAQELEKRLASILDQKYTKGVHVTVFIREHQKIAILGAVGRPGLYELVGPTTLLQILSEAGGLTAQAAKEIHVIRQRETGEKERILINLDELLKRSHDLDIQLQPKDEIIVPFDQLLNVYVYGEVRNPGAVQFLESKKITLLQAVAQAGGLTEWANAVQVMIKRKDPKTGKERNLWYNLKKIIDGKRPDVILEDGDIVIVR
jgi:polysaccharide export outer membrane protein